MTANKETN